MALPLFKNLLCLSLRPRFLPPIQRFQTGPPPLLPPAPRPPLLLPTARTTCTDIVETSPPKPPPITPLEVTDEILLYHFSGDPHSPKSFSDPRESYGPPLAILLPWESLSDSLLQKFLEFYAEKGFDVLIVSLKAKQFLYPCVSGHAMTVVSDLLKHLNETHKHRPYVFHGFSIGVYVFGEIMAQFSDQYETYREISNNVKGCIWDSPVDFLTAKPFLGEHLYPKNALKRWRCNRDVKKHFRKHYYDSIVYWLRSRDSFCNPIVKVPNLFLVSYTDLLSNPSSLHCIQKVLEDNKIPIFQKTWWNSPHCLHFEKYCYEYTYGMILFFGLANLYPDECGKYRSCRSIASLTNLRLRKKSRENFSE